MTRAAGFLLAALAASVTGGLAVSQAVTGAPINGPGGLWGSVLFLSTIAACAALLSLIPLIIRGFRVQDGIMTLVTPVRKTSGRHIRQVPLEQIAYVGRISQPGADRGILVTLRDGTRFPVFEADLGRGGTLFLDKLLEAMSQRGMERPPPP